MISPAEIRSRRFALLLLGTFVVGLAAPRSAPAQLTRGFDYTIEPLTTLDELGVQSELWVLEVQHKPVRMIEVELTDPKTGRKSRELVWYLVYRAVNRPIDRRVDDSDTTPVNDDDPPPPPGRPLFVPEFTLVTEGHRKVNIYRDEILPEAQAAISARERLRLKNSVEVAGPIPEETPVGSDSEDVIYGVATWRGVDRDTDFFTLYLEGFSNGYLLEDGPDGNPVMRRKTIVIDFWRPGDRFRQQEREVRVKEPGRWIYRPDDAPLEPPSKTASR